MLILFKSLILGLAFLIAPNVTPGVFLAISERVSPFFIVILSIIFLKDKVGIYRWSAIFIGFFGVVLIMKPTSEIFNFYSIFPILTAIAWSFSVIILKYIPEGHSTAKIQLYTLIFKFNFIKNFC